MFNAPKPILVATTLVRAVNLQHHGERAMLCREDALDDWQDTR